MTVRTIMKRSIVPIVMLCCLATLLWASEPKEEPKLDVREARLDNQGRFWVYKDGKTLQDKKLDLKPVPPYGIPYSPYAWMPEPATRMMQMTLEHKDKPYEGEMCMAVSIKWEDPLWCGVGFVSGPDKGKPGAPWWGKTPDGWYYNLSTLKQKRLVLYMRGANGGECVQWKVGFLANEKYGDSLTFPVETKELKLETQWKRYVIDLKEKNPDLSRICSLCFVVGQASQEDPDAPVTFFVDSVYFE
jgi:hypothetical protein